MQLPKFAGPQLPVSPPFFFKNMTATVFPLRARFDALERFCDGYLNIIPEQLGRFRPMFPYVYLMMLDYGGLAVQARNLGWFAQQEVMFCVPVEWYVVRDGRWVFHDWATIAPFIYVDDPLSMTLGRTLLGWPKSLVKLSPRLTGWMRDPSGSTREATMSAKVFTKAYADAPMEDRVILEVQRTGLSAFELPFDPDARALPWAMFGNAMRNLAGAGSAYAGVLKGLGLLPWHRGTGFDNYARMANRMAGMLFPFAPNLTANTINLKQFRRSDEPTEYSFQALTNGPMQLKSFNRGALLGETAMWTGDLSGGYTIDLAEWPMFPIAETLGLEAQYLVTMEGLRVSRLKPVMPFWYDVDMEYTQGSRIAWRGPDGRWRDEEGRYYTHATSASTDLAFNTLAGAGAQVMTGPFVFPSATLCVVPLLAEQPALQKLLNESLNAPLSEGDPGTEERFEVWAVGDQAYVYVVAAEWGPVTSRTNDVGDWANMGVTFYVPVKRSRGGRLVSLGLFAFGGLADGTTQACTMSEVYGIQTIEGEFHLPSVPFASGCGTSGREPRSLLKVNVEVLPTLGEGQQTQMREVLNLRDGGGRAFTEAEELSDSAEVFCRLLRGELVRKNAIAEQDKAVGRVCALELLTGKRPIQVYTLKQFRDGGKPDEACCQSLVQIPYTIQQIEQIVEIADPVRIEIADYPSLPIARMFGLVPREIRTGAGAANYTVEGVRPFWMRASLELGNGARLYHRTDMCWQVGTPSEATAPSPCEPRELTTELEAHISRSAPVRLARTIGEWLERQGPRPAGGPREEFDACQVDPQTILESILSREWEDRSTTSHRNRLRDSLVRDLDLTLATGGAWINESLFSIRGTQPLSGAERELCLRLAGLEHLLLALYEVDVDAPSEDRVRAAWSRWERAQSAGGVISAMLEVVVDSPQLLQLKGEVRSLDEDAFAHTRARREACIALVRGILRSLLPTARHVVDRALDEVVASLRKPDHCVLRSTGGQERERLFPLRDCYDKTWYVGVQRGDA